VNTAVATIVTLSSLSGEFVHIVVQVTRDRVPVAYPDWNLSVEDDRFDLGVADASAAQFTRLSVKLGKELNMGKTPTSAAGWHRFLSQKMCTLKEILQVPSNHCRNVI
jgi:CDK inhibitor PHO81